MHVLCMHAMACMHVLCMPAEAFYTHSYLTPTSKHDHAMHLTTSQLWSPSIPLLTTACLLPLPAPSHAQERLPEVERLRLQYDAARRRLEPLVRDPQVAASNLDKVQRLQQKFERGWLAWLVTISARCGDGKGRGCCVAGVRDVVGQRPWCAMRAACTAIPAVCRA
jgi:hypothetical protein